jgi:hypothetical protein
VVMAVAMCRSLETLAAKILREEITICVCVVVTADSMKRANRRDEHPHILGCGFQRAVHTPCSPVPRLPLVDPPADLPAHKPR